MKHGRSQVQACSNIEQMMVGATVQGSAENRLKVNVDASAVLGSHSYSLGLAN